MASKNYNNEISLLSNNSVNDENKLSINTINNIESNNINNNNNNIAYKRNKYLDDTANLQDLEFNDKEVFINISSFLNTENTNEYNNNDVNNIINIKLKDDSYCTNNITNHKKSNIIINNDKTNNKLNLIDVVENEKYNNLNNDNTDVSGANNTQQPSKIVFKQNNKVNFSNTTKLIGNNNKNKKKYNHSVSFKNKDNDFSEKDEDNSEIINASYNCFADKNLIKNLSTIDNVSNNHTQDYRNNNDNIENNLLNKIRKRDSNSIITRNSKKNTDNLNEKIISNSDIHSYSPISTNTMKNKNEKIDIEIDETYNNISNNIYNEIAINKKLIKKKTILKSSQQHSQSIENKKTSNIKSNENKNKHSVTINFNNNDNNNNEANNTVHRDSHKFRTIKDDNINKNRRISESKQETKFKLKRVNPKFARSNTVKRESSFLSPNNNYNSNNNNNNCSTSEIIKLLNIPTADRVLDEIKMIKQYLIKLPSFLKFLDKVPKNNQHDLLNNICTSLKHKPAFKNSILFKYGDKGENYYIILSGKVCIVIPKQEQIKLTREDYLRYLYRLKTLGEIEIFKNCMIHNSSIFHFNDKELEIINSEDDNYIGLLNLINESFSNNNELHLSDAAKSARKKVEFLNKILEDSGRSENDDDKANNKGINKAKNRDQERKVDNSKGFNIGRHDNNECVGIDTAESNGFIDSNESKDNYIGSSGREKKNMNKNIKTQEEDIIIKVKEFSNKISGSFLKNTNKEDSTNIDNPPLFTTKKSSSKTKLTTNYEDNKTLVSNNNKKTNKTLDILNNCTLKEMKTSNLMKSIDNINFNVRNILKKKTNDNNNNNINIFNISKISDVNNEYIVNNIIRKDTSISNNNQNNNINLTHYNSDYLLDIKRKRKADTFHYSRINSLYSNNNSIVEYNTQLNRSISKSIGRSPNKSINNSINNSNNLSIDNLGLISSFNNNKSSIEKNFSLPKLRKMTFLSYLKTSNLIHNDINDKNNTSIFSLNMSNIKNNTVIRNNKRTKTQSNPNYNNKIIPSDIETNTSKISKFTSESNSHRKNNNSNPKRIVNIRNEVEIDVNNDKIKINPRIRKALVMNKDQINNVKNNKVGDNCSSFRNKIDEDFEKLKLGEKVNIGKNDNSESNFKSPLSAMKQLISYNIEGLKSKSNYCSIKQDMETSNNVPINSPNSSKKQAVVFSFNNSNSNNAVSKTNPHISSIISSSFKNSKKRSSKTRKHSSSKFSKTSTTSKTSFRKRSKNKHSSSKKKLIDNNNNTTLEEYIKMTYPQIKFKNKSKFNNYNESENEQDQHIFKVVTVYKYVLVGTLEPGATFGEVALLSEFNKRSATILAVEDCEFGILNKQTYNKCLRKADLNSFKISVNSLTNNLIFVNYNRNKFKKFLYSHFKLTNYLKGSVIVQEGKSFSNNVFFVKSGIISVSVTCTVEKLSNILFYLKRFYSKMFNGNNFIEKCKKWIRKQKELEKEAKENIDLINGGKFGNSSVLNGSNGFDFYGNSGNNNTSTNGIDNGIGTSNVYNTIENVCGLSGHNYNYNSYNNYNSHYSSNKISSNNIKEHLSSKNIIKLKNNSNITSNVSSNRNSILGLSNPQFSSIKQNIVYFNKSNNNNEISNNNSRKQSKILISSNKNNSNTNRNTFNEGMNYNNREKESNSINKEFNEGAIREKIEVYLNTEKEKSELNAYSKHYLNILHFLKNTNFMNIQLNDDRNNDEINYFILNSILNEEKTRETNSNNNSAADNKNDIPNYQPKKFKFELRKINNNEIIGLEDFLVYCFKPNIDDKELKKRFLLIEEEIEKDNIVSSFSFNDIVDVFSLFTVEVSSAEAEVYSIDRGILEKFFQTYPAVYYDYYLFISQKYGILQDRISELLSSAFKKSYFNTEIKKQVKKDKTVLVKIEKTTNHVTNNSSNSNNNTFINNFNHNISKFGQYNMGNSVLKTIVDKANPENTCRLNINPTIKTFSSGSNLLHFIKERQLKITKLTNKNITNKSQKKSGFYDNNNNNDNKVKLIQYDINNDKLFKTRLDRCNKNTNTSIINNNNMNNKDLKVIDIIEENLTAKNIKNRNTSKVIIANSEAFNEDSDVDDDININNNNLYNQPNSNINKFKQEPNSSITNKKVASSKNNIKTDNVIRFENKYNTLNTDSLNIGIFQRKQSRVIALPNNKAQLLQWNKINELNRLTDISKRLSLTKHATNYNNNDYNRISTMNTTNELNSNIIIEVYNTNSDSTHQNSNIKNNSITHNNNSKITKAKNNSINYNSKVFLTNYLKAEHELKVCHKNNTNNNTKITNTKFHSIEPMDNVERLANKLNKIKVENKKIEMKQKIFTKSKNYKNKLNLERLKETFNADITKQNILLVSRNNSCESNNVEVSISNSRITDSNDNNRNKITKKINENSLNNGNLNSNKSNFLDYYNKGIFNDNKDLINVNSNNDSQITTNNNTTRLDRIYPNNNNNLNSISNNNKGVLSQKDSNKEVLKSVKHKQNNNIISNVASKLPVCSSSRFLMKSKLNSLDFNNQSNNYSKISSILSSNNKINTVNYSSVGSKNNYKSNNNKNFNKNLNLGSSTEYTKEKYKETNRVFSFDYNNLIVSPQTFSTTGSFNEEYMTLFTKKYFKYQICKQNQLYKELLKIKGISNTNPNSKRNIENRDQINSDSDVNGIYRNDNDKESKNLIEDEKKTDIKNN